MYMVGSIAKGTRREKSTLEPRVRFLDHDSPAEDGKGVVYIAQKC